MIDVVIQRDLALIGGIWALFPANKPLLLARGIISLPDDVLVSLEKVETVHVFLRAVALAVDAHRSEKGKWGLMSQSFSHE